MPHQHASLLMALALAAGSPAPSPDTDIPAARTTPIERGIHRFTRTLSPVGCYTSDLSPEEFERAYREHGFLPPGIIPGAAERYWVDNFVWTGDGLQGPSGIAKSAQLTYSFPDDEVPWGFAGVEDRNGPNELNALLADTFGPDNIDLGREYFRQVFAGYRKVGGLSYREVADDNSPMDKIVNRSPTRGDIRIGAVYLPSANGTLAFNAFPSQAGFSTTGGGDMTINGYHWTDTQIADPDDDFVFLRGLVGHEHGHGLGFIHSIPCDTTKLMEPLQHSGVDEPAKDEIRGIGRTYGDRYSGNHAAADAANLGNLTLGGVRAVIERNLSTNGAAGPNNTDEDWFKFTLGTPQQVTITVTPTGGLYVADRQSSGCSGLNPTNINAGRAGDLGVHLRSADGSAILFTSNVGGPGVDEVINAGTLATGAYTIRVFDNGPNPAEHQIVQLYELRVQPGNALNKPLAIAGVDKRIRVNTNCFFIGNIHSRANASALTNASYDWDLDDDGAYETLDDPRPVIQYPSNGDYAVRLRVTDLNGNFDTDTITVTAFGAQTEISACSPSSGPRNATVPITLTGTNLRYANDISKFSLLASTGVTLTGTPIPNGMGTQVTGLSLVVAPDAPAGGRILRVTNADNSGASTGEDTFFGFFTVTAPPNAPGAFSLLSPANNAILSSDRPTFAWGQSTGASNYSVQFSTNQNFSPLHSLSDVTSGSPFIPDGRFQRAQTYYWRVIASGIGGQSLSTPIQASFYVLPVPPACPGDLNNDGQRTTADLVPFLGQFGDSVPPGTGADFTNDGLVSTPDLAFFLGRFGQPCP
ncbi:MAG: PKD domain-containing protein [Planctomycetes bacterium]|nr:PKD domain-containing protein [Planctomycetota bacterium]